MKLRAKTITIILSCTFVLLISLFGLSNYVLMSGFQKVEQEDTIKNASRAKDAVVLSTDALISKSADWGIWDGAYEFVQDGNQKFVDENFAPAALPNLKVDILAFYNKEGKPMKLAAYDLDNDKPVEFPESLKQLTQPGSDLLTFDWNDKEALKSGIIMLPEGPLRFAARPVYDSEQAKPPKGVVIFARFLNAKGLQQISDVTHLDIQSFSINQEKWPSEVSSLKPEFTKDKTAISKASSEDHVFGYTIVNDYLGSPALLLKVKLPREIYLTGKGSLQTMLAAIGLLVLLVGGIITYSIDSSVVKRLVDLTSQVVAIGSKTDKHKQVHFQGQDEVASLGSSVNQMLTSLDKYTDQIKDSNKTISTMLNSVGQGFFIFDHNGVIASNYSTACEDLLETTPSGKRVHDVLKANEKDCTNWLNELFAETIDFESLAELGPKRYHHSENRFIALKYQPVRDENQKLSHVVCIATDLTSEMQARHETELQKQTTDRIYKMVKNKNEFINFIKETKSVIEFAKSELKKSDMDLSSLFRAIHTVKGAAAVFSVTDVKNFAHDFESELALLLKHPHEAPKQQPLLLSKTLELESLFNEFLKQNEDLLGASVIDGEKRVEIPFSRLKNFASMIQSSAPYPKLQSQFISDFISTPIGDSFKHFDASVEQLCEKLGKQINPIKFEGHDLPIVSEYYNELFSSLIHSFRNSADHGIEPSEDREMLGKSPAGNINVTFKKVQQSGSEWLQIQIADDGAGIDTEKIRAKLKESGDPNWEKYSAYDVNQKVFSSGLSTASQITETSGRGVGMDAIKHSCEKLGGKVWIESSETVGTTLFVHVPYVESFDSKQNKFSAA